MKNYLNIMLTLLGLTSVLHVSQAQNIGVNNPNPHPSAALDVTGTDKGLLVPRVALSATNNQSPVSGAATSLLVFNTANAGSGVNAVTPGYYYWTGSEWKRLNDERGSGSNFRSVSGTITATATGTFVVMPQMAMSFVAEDTTAIIMFNAAGASVNNCGQRSLNFLVRVNGVAVNSSQTSIEDVTNFTTNKIWDISIVQPVQLTPGSNVTIEVLWANPGGCTGLTNGPGTAASPLGSYRNLTVVEPRGSGTFTSTIPAPPSTTNWGISGNSGTNTGVNFIGTTDNVPLAFRVNNQHAGILDQINHNVMLGTGAGTPGTSGDFNVAIGDSAGFQMSTANNNTVIGFRAGRNLNTGFRNTLIGGDAARQLNGGADNVIIGHGSSFLLTTGSSNTIIGASTASNTTSIGNSNVILGRNAPLSPTVIGSFNVVVGENAGSANASLTQNNTIVGRSARIESSLGGTAASDNTVFGANAVIQDQPLLGVSKATAIGANAKTTNSTNMTAIGADAFVSGSNSMVLGSVNGVNGATATIKVGIGTSTPGATYANTRLDVVGEPTGQAPTIRAGGGGDVVLGSGGSLFFDDNYNYSSGNYIRPVAGANSMGFFTAGIERIKITNTGNVGIGVTSPTEKFMVAGNIDASGDLYTGAGNGVLNCGGGNMSTTINMIADAFVTPLNANGDEDLYIADDIELGGNGFKPGGGSWATASDARLKKDVTAFNDGLDKVLAIRPVTFKYNDKFKSLNNGKTYVGVIAQEIREVAPYTVEPKFFGQEKTEDENGTERIVKQGEEFLTYDSSALTYMLINSVKELKALSDKQQQKIDALELEVKRLSGK